jgi:hypothetical protein
VTNRTYIFRQMLERDDAYVRDGKAYRRPSEDDSSLPLYIRTGDRYTLLLAGDAAVADVVPASTRYTSGRGETTYV